jgi:hypothetical protein
VIVPLLAAAVAFTCHPAAVRTGAYAGEQSGLHAVPWVATTNGAFAGHLFYWGGTRFGRAGTRSASIFTTRFRRRVNPKVLWIARRRTPARAISIAGRRLDAPGTFRATEPRANGPLAQYPSYVEIPAAGCWRVTVSAGTLRGSVVFAAYDR